MATVNHVVVPNFAPLSPTGSAVFNQIWKLTRAMRKAGWKYLASGDGSVKDTSADPANDKWGTGTITNAGATATITIATPARGRAVVTGLTGIVATDKGRFLCITGSGSSPNNHYHQIEEYLSSTSVAIDARTFAVTGETASLTWNIRDPLGDSYPSALSSVQAWILLRGPSMLKIPITLAPVVGPLGSTFVRGENVVQATTGAEGEILGYVYDGVSTGYLVINPRRRGTGSGVYGWDSTYVITGSTSGATVTQSGSTVEYRHEMVFGKAANTTNGVMWLGCWDPVGEASDMLSASAKLTAASQTSPPGGNSDFPTYAWILLGTSTAIGSAQQWLYATASDANGNAQVMCADCIEEQNWSSDGSWTIAMATLSSTVVTSCTAGDHTGFAFQRCDDSEDGDLEPYVTVGPNSADLNVGTRITIGAVTSTVSHMFSSSSNYCTSTYSLLRGWRGRGMAGDSAAAWSDFEVASLRGYADLTSSSAIAANWPYIERQRTALVPTKVREPLWAVQTSNTLAKMRKGTMRWFGVVQGGEAGDTYDSKKWIQLSSKTAPFVAGPWDGSTTPILWV